MKNQVIISVFILFSMRVFAQCSPENKAAYDTINALILKGNYEEANKMVPRFLPKTKEDSGYFFYMKGELCDNTAKQDSALNYYLLSYKIFSGTKNISFTGTVLNELGHTYLSRSDLVKALDHFQRAIKAFEACKQEGTMAGALHNIGMIYWREGDFDRAKDFTRKAVVLNEKYKNYRWLVRNYDQLADIFIHTDQKQKDSGFFYSFLALKLAKQFTDWKTAAACYQQVGIAYGEFGDLKKARIYFDSSLAIKVAHHEEVEMISSYGVLGELMMMDNKPKEAEAYLKKAIYLAEKNKLLQYRNNCYRIMFETEEKLENYKEAFRYHKLFTQTKDSLHNDDLTRALLDKEYKFNFEKKEAELKAESEKQKIITEEEKKKQKLVTYSVSAGLLLVILLAVLMFRSTRIRKRANEELSEKNDLIVKQQAETERQKQLLEEKQKEIIDSILYAKRIQQALITSEIYIERVLNKLSRKK